PRADARAGQRRARRALLRADRRGRHRRFGTLGSARTAVRGTGARRVDQGLAGQGAKARPRLGRRPRPAALHRLTPATPPRTTRMQTLLPDGWAPPIGYANGIAVDAGRIVFVAGQVGWDAQQKFQSEDIVPQFEQALQNIVAVLAKAGAKPEHICRMTAYCCDKPAYMAARKDLGKIW